jgi:uncharacterized protein YbaR (Trm112 family)
MKREVLPYLECPRCHGDLAWAIDAEDEEGLTAAEARCTQCASGYSVRERIAAFLTADVSDEDLWQSSASALAQAVEGDDRLRSALMEAPPASLAPADLFFRALLTEERGDFAEGERLAALARDGLYAPAYRACHRRQIEWVVRRLEDAGGPVVDLASGRGDLAGPLLHGTAADILITDFSLRVLRRNRRWLEAMGHRGRASLLAFDARRTPFRPASLWWMTTNLGLANIRDPGPLLDELRRVVGGQLLAICHFYPPQDDANRQAIVHLGLDSLLYKEQALASLQVAGWKTVIENACIGDAMPTPTSRLIEDAGIDALPVAPTQLEWCVLVCS